MKTELQRITFTVPRNNQWPVKVYEPEVLLFENTRPRFVAPVYPTTGEVPREILEKLVFSRSKSPELPAVAWARNQKRPEVICDDVDWLVRFLARLDARNLSRDRVFGGYELHCSAFVLPLPEFARETLQNRYPNAELMLTLQTVEILR